MPPTLVPSPTEATTEPLVPSPTEATTEPLEAAARPAPGRYLAVEAGGQQRMVPLPPGATHIGRSWAADVMLEDQTVSRRHAIVFATTDSVRILDDRSANGTRVNGRCVTGAELSDGDVIRVGRSVLVYREIA
jgi:pSer/pThr/pTyr-binding forkhead associated (FHA) protein